MSDRYDVIVIGGGHAGSEAAAAAARSGARTALVTLDRRQIGAMSCNPAIGGLGKGHLVREVDAFDGIIGRAADAGAIHHRMLNSSKGAAVQGPRIQADRARFRSAVQEAIRSQDRLTVVEGEAASLIFEPGGQMVSGLRLADGRELTARAVVLATGTFLNGKLHFGLDARGGGRVGEASSVPLAEQLRALSLPMGRLKTGTPPRLDGRTIDWSAIEIQPSDGGSWTFSALTSARICPQISCGITRTNATTHALILQNLDRSPMFAGVIEGRGPRYCPSIEDKVTRFGDRDSHQIFLEPEGLDDSIVYPNGISTSLPLDVQQALIASIEGLRDARIVQAGYAVEYDHIDPRALDPTLGLQKVRGLYCAGQINGTTGYEEAAAQGLVAGLNAAAYALESAPILFDRAESYIGVMVDDLVLHGVTEPYRMLTARAEYRLRLRADNAETRLTPKAIEAGAVSDVRSAYFASRETSRQEAGALLDQTIDAATMEKHRGAASGDGAARTLFEWLSFPDVTKATLIAIAPALSAVRSDVLDEAITDARYAPYIMRQSREVARMRADEVVLIPDDISYASVGGLSNEMVERLEAARPTSLGAAGRVRGVTPAALAAILVRCRRAAA